MNLSEHFTLAEAVYSSTAQRLGFDNTPSQQVIANATIAAEGMEEVRALLGNLGIHVDSWIRCEQLEIVLTVNDFKAWCAKNNRPLKSESDWAEYFARKGHPQGWAIDFICSGYGTPLEIVQAIAASSIKFDQCIQEGNWAHISFDPRMRQQVLTATFVKGAATYSKGVTA